MKTIDYTDIKCEQFKGFARTWFTKEKEIKPILVRKYCANNEDKYSPVASSLFDQMPKILYLAGGKLEGKRILDLGCGSVATLDNAYGSTRAPDFEPWLCRALHESGVKVIGIDYFSPQENSQESFEFHKRNLLEKGALDFIPDNSIDIANARFLFNSPTLLNLYEGINFSQSISNALLPQLERIVKPDGFFINRENV